VIPVLWSAGGLVAVDKPAGVPVVPGRTEGGGPPLRERLEAQLGRRLWVVHRLDRDTSGVLLLALDAPTHRAASLAFEHGRADKRYLALVSPPLAPRAPGGRRAGCPLAAPGCESPSRARREGRDGPSSRRWRPSGTSRWSRRGRLTGRSHQIRVHLRHAGAPLLVDPQYGRPEPVSERRLGGDSDAPVLARTPLHASRLVLPAAEGLPSLDVTAPLPGDMARALAVLRH
jgi:tRNA pseudouridine32 synthase/23S rRNA pseudouridine746 synthase/23S rRNA pseudouridine955/2504/2580 synthase